MDDQPPQDFECLGCVGILVLTLVLLAVMAGGFVGITIAVAKWIAA